MKWVLLTLAFLASIYFLLVYGFIRFNYPSRQEFPNWGIDVSHHQGAIDWAKVKAENFQFTYIKATEGGDFRDSSFESNWRGALSVGLKVGAYHFFTFCRAVEDQVKNFRSVVPVDSNALPPAIDLEFGGNCAKVPDHDKMMRDIKIFTEELTKTYQKSPILYVTEEFYKSFLEDSKLESRLWVRDVFMRPRFVPEDKWLIWQFGNRGRVAGITGPVDMNVVKTGLEFN